ncbi:hypothetical protein AAC387_Pa10g0492 [Persea americana]
MLQTGHPLSAAASQLPPPPVANAASHSTGHSSCKQPFAIAVFLCTLPAYNSHPLPAVHSANLSLHSASGHSLLSYARSLSLNSAPTAHSFPCGSLVSSPANGCRSSLLLA